MIGLVSWTLTVKVGGLAGFPAAAAAAAAFPAAAFLAFFAFFPPAAAAAFAVAGAATGTKSELMTLSGWHPADGSPEVTV